MVALPPSSEMLIKTVFISISEIIGESKVLLELFITLLLLSNE
jgi:hypothetical protein